AFFVACRANEGRTMPNPLPDFSFLVCCCVAGDSGMNDDPLKTSLTLLARLRHDPKDQAAWSEFVARYGPSIFQWCRGWGVQEADAQDVTQDVLLKLNGLMARFVYDSAGSFRGWLRTLTHHAWCDLAAERRRAGLGASDGRVFELFASLQAG